MIKSKAITKTHTKQAAPPFKCIALLLQGGGALGAYQGGVYQALAEANIHPNWVAGISIGAMSSAIIAGNKPEQRVEKLRGFWEFISSNTWLDKFSDVEKLLARGDYSRRYFNQAQAMTGIINGIKGFYKPRFPSPWLSETGSVEATSYYDTAPLRETLLQFIDFDILNSGKTHFSIGAVNVKTGNLTYFDTNTHVITPEHIMASGALPPGFPAVEINGEYYWDGGLVSNTPLEWVLDTQARDDTLVFQVDLWSAQGHMPKDMAEVATRQKEIMYSSRTRAATDRFKYAQRMRHAIARLIDELPPDLKKSKDAKLLSTVTDSAVYNIIHLIYHTRSYEGDSKDYEFSFLSMQEHWTAGYNDTVHTLRHPEVLERHPENEGVFTFDIAHMRY